jgi:hypothetical protein
MNEEEASYARNNLQKNEVKGIQERKPAMLETTCG